MNMGFSVSTSTSGSKMTILQVPVECARPRELADTAAVETVGSLGQVSGTRSGYHYWLYAFLPFYRRRKPRLDLVDHGLPDFVLKVAVGRQ